MAIFTDSFTGSSGDLVSARTGWNKYGSGSTDVFQVNASNQAKIAGAFPDDGAMYGQDPAAVDHFVEATLYANAVASKCFPILGLRVVDRNEFVSLSYDDSGGAVWRIRVNGTSVDNTSAFGAPNGEKYRFQISGSTCTVYKDDALVWSPSALSLSGSSLTATKVGCHMLGVGGTPQDPVLDNWRSGLVSDLGGGGGYVFKRQLNGGARDFTGGI